MPAAERSRRSFILSEAYVEEITRLPEDPVERLSFYHRFLQDEESMLARDAYDEFAIAPYSVVKGLAPEMNREQLVAWIGDPEMPTDRKRLYLTMLGVCGDKQNLPQLEKMLRSNKKSSRAGLDALNRPMSSRMSAPTKISVKTAAMMTRYHFISVS